MNIVKEANDKLIYVQKESISLSFIVECMTKDNTSIIYVKDKNKVIGAINKGDIYPKLNISFDKEYIVKINHNPKANEIEKIFSDKAVIPRISIWVNGVLYGEYRNFDYPFLPKSVAKNIISLRYIELFKNRILEYLNNQHIKKIGLISNVDIVNYFKNSFPAFSFYKINGIANEGKYDLIFDFKYGKYLRKVLQVKNKKLFDFASFLLPIAVSTLIEYLEKNQINYMFIYDSIFEGMKNLSVEEKKVANQKTKFDELIKNSEYLKKFCCNEIDLCFMEKRDFKNTSPFFSDFTIKQTDIESDSINIKNGIRYSGVFSKDYNTEIHFFGPCSILGLCGPDDYTFEYQLQEKLNKRNADYKVFNHGVMLGDNSINSIVDSLMTKLKTNDCVYIYFMEKELLPLIPSNRLINFCDIFNRVKRNAEICFFDVPGHCNRRANSIISDYFFQLSSYNFKTKAKNGKRENFACRENINITKDNNLNIFNPDMYSHFERLSKVKNYLRRFTKIGTVTIYASPFTKGHQYLINMALKHCDIIVVFVVSDNFHTLNSIDRVEMVRRNYVNNEKVIVIPTETYFASKQYFPEYSSKVSGSELQKTIYYQEIASSKYLYAYLGITVRFLGEEETDSVTQKYNAVVRKCCKENNIELFIIPRLKINGVEVSGSSCRNAILNKDMVSMQKLLPLATYEYVINEM